MIAAAAAVAAVPILPKGTSSGRIAVNTSASKLLSGFCNSATPRVLWPIVPPNPVDNRLKQEVFLQEYAGYLVAFKWGSEQKFYGHQTLEIYFNASVLLVEGAVGGNPKFKFDEIWQQNMIRQITRTAFQRILENGEELSTKTSLGRKSMLLVSRQLMALQTQQGVEQRVSVNAERSAVGRTAESALAMLSDITKDNDKGVYKIEWREGKTSKTKSIFLCQVSIVHSVVSQHILCFMLSSSFYIVYYV